MGLPHNDASGKSKWAILGAYRFLLASLVVYVHIGGMIRMNKVIYVPLASVICFLVISGYSIAHSLEREPEHFYRRRFARIYPTYFVTLLMTLSVAFLCQAKQLPMDVSQSDPFAMLGSFLMVQGILTPIWGFIGPSWTLSLECFYYVLAPWLNRLRLRYLLAFWTISALAYMIHSYETGENFNNAEYGLSMLGLGWAWLTGFLYHRFRDLPIAFWLLVLGAPLVYTTFVWNDGRLGVGLLFLTGILLASDLRFKISRRWLQICNALGDFSYPLYICHFPLLFLYIAVTGKAGEDFGKPSLWPFLGLTVVVTAAILRFVDRPVRKWILSRTPHAVA